MRAPGADATGRIAGTMLEVLLAEITEPERLRRGRRYTRLGAVGDLAVAHGAIAAAVQGSRAKPYDVELRVVRAQATARNPPSLANLVPKRGHLTFECSCPDWEEPCKHAVAVLTKFAERVVYEPSLLLVWRGIGAPADEVESPHELAARTADATPHNRAERDALDEFLGTNAAIEMELPDLTPLPHLQMRWDEPWSVMLHDALRVLVRSR